ncbi:type VII secretion protein EccB [Nocardioides caeni]|uniref:Type VII secretion protein EccB n=1 Tax=Nocardioides caeni TaxID=574700 RepID=A0A4S8ND70_9ACTN|nr:type VII secretion protein EccB [Nocardioides caeni]THV12884.1 type VII secretion protein EccB [Nocardioides caeni]
MATKKDLVEAYSFSRRRLVTAFVSGAPGGREVEPARPGRMIIGGIALAVLLVAGAAVAGALTKREPVDWKEPGLVTDDHGALYVILPDGTLPGPTLRPVINVTSAQLILGADVETKSVPDDKLAEQREGPSIGILDAPTTVPTAGELVNSGWVSCTATGQGMLTEISDDPAVEAAPDQGFVVRAGRGTFLIAEADAPGLPRRAYSYRLDPGNDGLLPALGISLNDLITVPEAWLDLFPVGGSLDGRGLGISGLGDPAGLPGAPGALIGDLYLESGRPYVITADGMRELSPFAAEVLRHTSLGPRLPRELDADDADFQFATGKPYADAHWPEEVLAGSPSASDQVCGVLVTEEGEEPAVQLARVPDGGGMADAVEEGDREVSVLSGRGALVRTAGWASDSGGSVQLVDDRGQIYPIAGEAELGQLGYTDVPAVVVPDTWGELFKPGPELSILAALCPPAIRDQAPTESSCG